MGPKVEAALDFVDATDGYAVITDASSMASSLGTLGIGVTPGTRIVREILELPKQGALQ
jgi:carbamate kinase